MKTKILKSKPIALLSALFAIIFAVVLTITSSSSSVFATENSAVLFDGTSSSATIPAANTTVEGITVNIGGMSEMQSISSGFTLDGMTYNKAIKTGGKSSSSRYFSFTVPATLAKFTVKVVAACQLLVECVSRKITHVCLVDVAVHIDDFGFFDVGIRIDRCYGT